MADNDIFACGRCHKRFRADGFKTDRLGERHKSCIECSQRNARVRAQAHCEHKRQRAQCHDCGGSPTCEHKRQRAQCRDCGGSGICEHNRHRHSCRMCKDPIGYLDGLLWHAEMTQVWGVTYPMVDFSAGQLMQHLQQFFTVDMTPTSDNWRFAFVVPLGEGEQTHAIRLERMRLPNIMIALRD